MNAQQGIWYQGSIKIMTLHISLRISGKVRQMYGGVIMESFKTVQHKNNYSLATHIFIYYTGMVLT